MATNMSEETYFMNFRHSGNCQLVKCLPLKMSKKWNNKKAKVQRTWWRPVVSWNRKFEI